MHFESETAMTEFFKGQNRLYDELESLKKQPCTASTFLNKFREIHRNFELQETEMSQSEHVALGYIIRDIVFFLENSDPVLTGDQQEYLKNALENIAGKVAIVPNDLKSSDRPGMPYGQRSLARYELIAPIIHILQNLFIIQQNQRLLEEKRNRVPAVITDATRDSVEKTTGLASEESL